MGFMTTFAHENSLRCTFRQSAPIRLPTPASFAQKQEPRDEQARLLRRPLRPFNLLKLNLNIFGTLHFNEAGIIPELIAFGTTS
jgi:hypothetical protein